MLILSRKIGEAVVIDDEVTVRILEIKGGQVKVGIEAPSRVTVHREEIYKAILEENIRAGLEVPGDLSSVSAGLKKKDWSMFAAGKELIGEQQSSKEKEKNNGGES